MEIIINDGQTCEECGKTCEYPIMDKICNDCKGEKNESEC